MNASIINQMNQLGKNKIPFIFIFDFEMNKPLVFPFDEVPKGIMFKINAKKNYRRKTIKKPLNFKFIPTRFSTYKIAFDHVLKEINLGNSYLLNLCTKTEVKMNYSLKEIFFASKAKYKLYMDYHQERITMFSPEIFIKIKNNKIYAHPMKGTIDASIPNAKEKLLQDPKEQAEHFTIVDLIRNDLSIVSKKVKVESFRYLDFLETTHKNLWQTSTKISGELPVDYHEKIGSLLAQLLPAGSISGAPKKKTCEIIKETEGDERGYYTGVLGYFDGEQLDAGIMIRYLEQTDDKYFYRSGGGITFRSECQAEYDELNDKIYVPTN